MNLESQTRPRTPAASPSDMYISTTSAPNFSSATHTSSPTTNHLAQPSPEPARRSAFTSPPPPTPHAKAPIPIPPYSETPPHSSSAIGTHPSPPKAPSIHSIPHQNSPQLTSFIPLSYPLSQPDKWRPQGQTHHQEDASEGPAMLYAVSSMQASAPALPRHPVMTLHASFFVPFSPLPPPYRSPSRIFALLFLLQCSLAWKRRSQGRWADRGAQVTRQLLILSRSGGECLKCWGRSLNVFAFIFFT